MKRILSLTLQIIAAASLLALAACTPSSGTISTLPTGSGSEATPAAPSPLPTSDLQSGGGEAGTAVVVTAVGVPSSGLITALPASTSITGGTLSTPVPAPTLAPGEQLVITMASAGQTYSLKVGERFLVNMGEGLLDWTVTVQDPSIVSRVIGILVIKGAQGVYEAKAPGTTTLSITGDPFCRKSTPPCMMPSRIVMVTLVVK